MCVIDDDSVCTDDKNCKTDSACVANKTNSAISHCKVKAVTNAACGITASDNTAAGTPAGCLAITDTCEASSSTLISYCKTKVADGEECKASNVAEDTTLAGTEAACSVLSSTCKNNIDTSKTNKTCQAASLPGYGVACPDAVCAAKLTCENVEGTDKCVHASG